jgi:YVTN family beta-propeller protein
MRLALACVLLLLAACGAEERQRRAPIESSSSRVDVFLRCVDPSAPPIAVEFAAAWLVDGAGEERALELSRSEVRSPDLARRERIAGAILPPAAYSRLALEVRGAGLLRAEGRIPLTLLSPLDASSISPGDTLRVELPVEVRLGEREAASIFLDWSAGESLVGGATFSPRWSASLESPQLALGLLYVADAGTSSVLTLDRATGQVVGTFKSGAQPRALALTRDRRLLWVASGGDGSILALDARSGKAETSLPIAFGAGITDLVFTDDDRSLAATLRELDAVALADFSGRNVVQVSVGREPVRLACAPSLQRLFTADSASDSVSVVDTAARALVASVQVEARPVDVDLDRDEKELYVAHSTSPHLLVIDARSLATLATVFVGAGATDVLADRRSSRVFVARARPPEVLVVDRRLGSVVRRIPVSARIESMTQWREGSRVYGAAPEAGAVLVIDVVTGKEQTPLRCGERPTDVVVAE